MGLHSAGGRRSNSGARNAADRWPAASSSANEVGRPVLCGAGAGRLEARRRRRRRLRARVGGQISLVALVCLQMLAALMSWPASVALQVHSIGAPPFGGKLNRQNSFNKQLKLSHHVLCEPISQLNDLSLECESEQQFMIILEAYYSDLYPEIVCPRASGEAKLNRLTGSQLVSIFRQLYSPQTSGSSSGNSDNHHQPRAKQIRFNPTLNYGAQRPFCLDDLKQSFQAKCSGRRRCHFSRNSDHQFPACVNLKPGHAFVRYLCIDNALLVKYCNANAMLASHSSVMNRVKRETSERALSGASELFADLPAQLDPSELPVQLDTLDFGFVASPGYPNFYATPSERGAREQDNGFARQTSCAWTIEAEVGQRVTVKLLDASLAPRELSRQSEADYTTSTSLFPSYEDLEEQTSPAARPSAPTPTFSLPKLADGKFSANLSFNQSLSHDGLDGSTGEMNTFTKPKSNVHFEPLLGAINGTEERRIVFEIDEFDYETLRVQLASKLQQVNAQCQGYDRLVVRDGGDSGANSGIGAEREQREAAKTEFELISKLPITLYKNRLIDFENETIFKRFPEENFGAASTTNKRVNYKALVEALNPLQLVWLYQQNVSLCSTNQLEQLSAPLDKNKISFTSTANTIQLDLVSGHMFNPTNRGVLFWYHKHGCPATTKLPSRSRLVFRNESTEIFHCFPGFVFNDTRQSVRVRKCSLRLQVWFDESEPSEPDDNPAPMAPCVYVEDLANAISSSEQVGENHKFDRLTAKEMDSPSRGQIRVTSSSNDVAVEVVGVPTPSNLHNSDDVDLLSVYLNDIQSASHGKQSLQQQASNSSFIGGFVQDVLGYLRTNDEQAAENDRARSILTHQPLREQRIGDKELSLWSRASNLLDRRLVVPAILVLFVFVLINLIIYVIFLVALPKFARYLCSNPCNGLNGAKKDCSPPTNKLNHYESDYSVTMGMSL